MPPCLLWEDEHLLVVNKPAGLNTHAPSPYAGEGIYDWLRHREPRWARLAIIHRLDKETSGVLVFSKSTIANRSLTAQFTERKVHKNYLLLTDRVPQQSDFTLKSALVRAGERYVSRAPHRGVDLAETTFRECRNPKGGALRMFEATPVTGRTHQIRVHAAEAGIPILGDTLYGGTPAARVYLHAAELTLTHPGSGEAVTFRAPVETEWADADRQPGTPLPFLALRSALIDPAETSAYRLVHGAADGWPGLYVDRLGDFLLSQSAQPLSPPQVAALAYLARLLPARAVYHKTLTRHMRRADQAEACPKLVQGEPAPERFTVRENGLQFELSFSEGYSVGLFLDQRDNRRRLLTRHIAADFPLAPEAAGGRPLEVLNTFAYTCGFSLCAAKAGARTTSLDLSKRWLEWGKRNFLLNGLDPAGHDFIYGEAFDWLRRLAKKQRLFDVILLDPPTFSQSKASGAFRAEKDYGRLVQAAVPLLKPNGVLFASTNAADWPPEDFLAEVESAICSVKQSIIRRHYVPQPADFPISRAEPAYLKTVWLQIGAR